MYQSLQDKGCTFPACKCKVPDYAYSEDKRKEFCRVEKQVKVAPTEEQI